MKKEKQVKSYSRKTKSGKMVTVKAHTAKYDSAEDIAKEILKKKGAGSELEARMKNKGKQLELPFDEEEKIEKDEKDEKKVPEKEKTAKVAKGKSTKTKTKNEKQPADKQSLSQADFKAWYHWDMDSDPNNESAKRAEKCLKKKLGAKKYNELLNKETENYSSRGHIKSFKALSEAMEDNTAVRGAKKVKGAATAQKEMAKQMGATDAVKKFDKKSEAKSTIKSKSSPAKLTDDDIEDIELTRGQIKKIATRFGASERAVGSWFAGGNWRNETDKDAKEGAKLDKTIRKVLGSKVYEKASMEARMLEAVLKATKDTPSKSKSNEGVDTNWKNWNSVDYRSNQYRVSPDGKQYLTMGKHGPIGKPKALTEKMSEALKLKSKENKTKK